MINVFAQVLSASDADAEEEGGFPSGGKTGGSALVNIEYNMDGESKALYILISNMMCRLHCTAM